VRFSVIYSVDVPKNMSIIPHMPCNRKPWNRTERDDQECKHRKLCALLTQRQFDRFVDDLGLQADETETMGSLGAPGFGVGWSPAISFTSGGQDIYCNAYVTPIPDDEEGYTNDEEGWKKVRSDILERYGGK
jgi:hypothetical protein